MLRFSGRIIISDYAEEERILMVDITDRVRNKDLQNKIVSAEEVAI